MPGMWTNFNDFVTRAILIGETLSIFSHLSRWIVRISHVDVPKTVVAMYSGASNSISIVFKPISSIQS